jgi:hypothetical protein
MTFEFPCDGCRRFLRVSFDKEGQQVRCPGCGTVSVAAQVAHTAEEEEEIVMADEAEESFPARLSQIDRSIDQIDRRWSPAARKADGPCPNCRKLMKTGAVLCIECGFDLRKGRIRGIKIKRFERDWLAGYPIWVMALTAAVLLSELTMATFILLAKTGVVAMVIAPGLLVLTFPILALLGWFNVLHLRRDRQGTAWLRVRRHMCFLPYSSEDLPLSEFKAVLIGYRNGVDFRTGGLYFFLVLPHLLACPILLILVLRLMISRRYYVRASGGDPGGISGTYWVCLRDIRRQEIRVYYGGNERLTRDIAETLSEAGDLEIVR